MSDMNDFNAGVIEEFRANGGKAGGMFEGKPLLLLHNVGAKSGTEFVTPLVYLADGDDYVIFASKGGAPNNPGWYHNLKAGPNVSIEVGTEKLEVTAEEATGAERDRLYERPERAAAAVRRIRAENRPEDPGHRALAALRISSNRVSASARWRSSSRPAGRRRPPAPRR